MIEKLHKNQILRPSTYLKRNYKPKSATDIQKKFGDRHFPGKSLR